LLHNATSYGIIALSKRDTAQLDAVTNSLKVTVIIQK